MQDNDLKIFQGDSGAAIVCQYSTGWAIVGVNSRILNHNFCYQTDVFTDVRLYTPWIDTTIKKYGRKCTKESIPYWEIE